MGQPKLALFWSLQPEREPDVTFPYFGFWPRAGGAWSHLPFPLRQLPVQLE